MNIYLISQDKNDACFTYDIVVVAADSEDEARHIQPDPPHEDLDDDDPDYLKYPKWANPNFVKVKLIGIASEGQESGVIIASTHDI